MILNHVFATDSSLTLSVIRTPFGFLSLLIDTEPSANQIPKANAKSLSTSTNSLMFEK